VAVDLRDRLHGHRVAAALAVLAIVVAGPFVQRNSAQPESRIALTAAVWDRQTFDLSGYPLHLPDVSFHGDEPRSDKAPAQPFLAVPAYAVARALGAEPATVPREFGNLTLWAVTLWSSVLPFALLLVLVHRLASAVSPTAALEVTLALGFGSLLLVFSTILFAHVLAGLLGLAAWAFVRGAHPTPRALVAGGLLAGLAAATEYPMIALPAAVGLVLIVRERRSFVAFALGAAVPVLLTMAYQWRAFGSPWTFAHAAKGKRLGVATLDGPSWHTLIEAFVGDRGLLVMSPIVIVGLWCAVRLLARRGPLRADAFVAVGVSAFLLAIISMWGNPWGGGTPGPRYLLPAVPLLAVPLAAEWRSLRRLALLAGALGFVVGLLPVLTDYAIEGSVVLRGYLDLLLDGELTDTVWTMWLGGPGWAVHAATVAGAAFVLARVTRGGVRVARPATRAAPRS
jgi:hypothetical protein